MSETYTLRIRLPHRISRADAQEAIARIERVLHLNADARFALAAVVANTGGCEITASAGGFSATHWAALADTCMERSAEKLAAAGQIDLLRQVERARAELGFEGHADA